MSVGHAATYPFAYEMFGKEERTAMTHVDSQTVQCPLAGCLTAVVIDISENNWPERRPITHSVKLPCPALSLQTPGPGNRRGKNEGVHNVHTREPGPVFPGAGGPPRPVSALEEHAHLLVIHVISRDISSSRSGHLAMELEV